MPRKRKIIPPDVVGRFSLGCGPEWDLKLPTKKDALCIYGSRKAVIVFLMPPGNKRTHMCHCCAMRHFTNHYNQVTWYDKATARMFMPATEGQ